MQDFETMLPGVRAFLDALAANNSRDWFQAHKARYEATLKAPAEALLAVVAEELAAMVEATVETKLFRISRDVRFSKDKTPYHTHLHMRWRPRGTDAAWMFGIARHCAKAGWGVMEFGTDALATWRDLMGGEAGAAVADAIRDTGLRPSEPELKRVPAPWPQDHPRAGHLRRKGLMLWADVADARPGTLLEVFARAEPARRALAGVV